MGGGCPAVSILTPSLGLLWQAEGEVDLDRRAYAGECMSWDLGCFAWMPTGLGSRGCVLGAGQVGHALMPTPLPQCGSQRSCCSRPRLPR